MGCRFLFVFILLKLANCILGKWRAISEIAAIDKAQGTASAIRRWLRRASPDGKRDSPR
jgi:hypothetical protein